MREVDDGCFEGSVLRNARPVVVDFWAPWCRPCQALEPVLEALAEEHAGRVDFVKLDVDRNPEIAMRYGILSLPTTILFAGGEARETVMGARGRAHYERAFAAWLAA